MESTDAGSISDLKSAQNLSIISHVEAGKESAADG
jgi:hypothetical protein